MGHWLETSVLPSAIVAGVLLLLLWPTEHSGKRLLRTWGIPDLRQAQIAEAVRYLRQRRHPRPPSLAGPRAAVGVPHARGERHADHRARRGGDHAVTAPRITVDPESGVAPWRQVRDQLLHLVRAGALPVGARLPTIRQLAGDLGLAAGTVARVYRELEADGILHTARRQGTVVAGVPSVPAGELTRAAAGYAALAAALGADAHTAAAAVIDAWPADR